FDPLYRIGNQMAETFAEHTEWKGEEIRMQSIHILKRMQILDPEEILQKYPHQVSGGTLQRIMIGIAMALKPSLLIADEPTTAIDSITQFEILQEFARIKKEYNTAMIFITHDLSAVSCIADRILVMNQGQIVDEGNLYHILNHAEDTYTRLLVEKQRAVMTSYRNAIHSKGGRICLR
ncbi:MAG: ABC transporter ATP-binding protein, partial [Clostridiaceae bacterium]|nr:ABC transporter ATP-binding protein [Clostridiaceae bacterium]